MSSIHFCDFCRQQAYAVADEDTFVCKACAKVTLKPEALETVKKIRKSNVGAVLQQQRDVKPVARDRTIDTSGKLSAMERLSVQDSSDHPS